MGTYRVGGRVGRLETRLIAALQRSAAFEHASLNHLFRLADAAEARELEDGELLFEAGAAPDAFFILLDGGLRAVERRTLAEHEYWSLRREYRPTCCVGEHDILTGLPRPHRVVASGHTLLMRIGADVLTGLMARSRSFRAAVRGADIDQPQQALLVEPHERAHVQTVGLLTQERDFPASAFLAQLASMLDTEYDDRVVVLHPQISTTGPVVDLAPMHTVGRVRHLRCTGDPRRLLTSPEWQALVPGLDFVFIDTGGCDPEQAQAFRPHLEEAIDVFVDAPTRWPRLSVDAIVRPVAMLPPGSFGRGRPRLPSGVCRVRLDLRDLARAGRDPWRLGPDNRARFARLARFLSDRTVGLALGGGGAWGYAHVPLIRALHERGVPIDVVSGSSFGAVTAAYYCAHGLDGLDRLVEARHRFHRASTRSFISSTAIQRVVAEDVSGYLEDLETTLLPVATEVGSGAMRVLRGTSIAHAVRASGSFPGVFSATVDKGPQGVERYVDGGISSNVPDSALLTEGADFIVASNVVPPPRSREAPQPLLPGKGGLWLNEANPFLRLVDSFRSVFILMHAAGHADASLADVLFDTEPNRFRPGDFDRAVEIIDSVGHQVQRTADRVERRWRARAGGHSP